VSAHGRALIAELDAVAWLRGRGEGGQPDPVAAAALAQIGGAGGVALRLTGEPGVLFERDARLLREIAPRSFQLVLPASSHALKVALEIRPESVTWTGEGEHGGFPDPLDLPSFAPQLAGLMRTLGEARIRSTVLVQPDPHQIKAAHKASVSAVRIAAHGERFGGGPEAPLREVEDSARLALKLGLRVGAMGIVDRDHLIALASIDAIHEFQVGAVLIAQAVLVGMERATADLVACLR
jgi:pyridoxine 5-phosphate synthase